MSDEVTLFRTIYKKENQGKESLILFFSFVYRA